jgi:hypothetical protein
MSDQESVLSRYEKEKHPERSGAVSGGMTRKPSLFRRLFLRGVPTYQDLQLLEDLIKTVRDLQNASQAATMVYFDKLETQLDAIGQGIAALVVDRAREKKAKPKRKRK